MNITHDKDSYSDIRFTGLGDTLRIQGAWSYQTIDGWSYTISLADNGYYPFFKARRTSQESSTRA